MTAPGDVPPAIVAMVRAACRALPEAYEEDAWVGIRWRIRTRTFAHVLTIADGRPPGYVRAAGTDGPAVVLMFRAGGDELTALRSGGTPFFAPPWRADEVGMLVDERTGAAGDRRARDRELLPARTEAARGRVVRPAG